MNQMQVIPPEQEESKTPSMPGDIFGGSPAGGGYPPSNLMSQGQVFGGGQMSQGFG